jgi:hypothetical protein
MTDTKLIDHRVILLKNYREYKIGEEFRCNGFYYHPVKSDGRIFDIEFIQKRKDLFKDK